MPHLQNILVTAYNSKGILPFHYRNTHMLVCQGKCCRENEASCGQGLVAWKRQETQVWAWVKLLLMP